MTIQVYQYRLPLKRELPLGGRVYRYREGLLLERDGEWAEAAPLPAFSRETMDDVLTALRTNREPPPSLAFALDCLKRPMQACSVPMNVLLQGSAEQVIKSASEVRSTSYGTVKLKVGRTDCQSDIELVHRVREQLGDGLQLRLDANRAWTYGQALKFAKGIESLSIEYIEEPLQDSSECERLFEEAGLPYALDETLAEKDCDYDLVTHFPNARAFVCKPTILGGRRRMEWLSETGKPIVFSAAFESGLGIGRIAQWADEYSSNVPAGLDTYSWLESDTLQVPPTLQNGCMQFGGKFEVNIAELRRIEL